MSSEDALLCVPAVVIIQKKTTTKKEKTQGLVSEGRIALVTWNTTWSHSIFKFNYNSYKHFQRLGSKPISLSTVAHTFSTKTLFL